MLFVRMCLKKKFSPVLRVLVLLAFKDYVELCLSRFIWFDVVCSFFVFPHLTCFICFDVVVWIVFLPPCVYAFWCFFIVVVDPPPGSYGLMLFACILFLVFPRLTCFEVVSSYCLLLFLPLVVMCFDDVRFILVLIWSVLSRFMCLLFGSFPLVIRVLMCLAFCFLFRLASPLCYVLWCVLLLLFFPVLRVLMLAVFFNVLPYFHLFYAFRCCWFYLLLCWSGRSCFICFVVVCLIV